MRPDFYEQGEEANGRKRKAATDYKKNNPA
jgi:hypothetical protein